jgi:hypothetical protein
VSAVRFRPRPPLNPTKTLSERGSNNGNGVAARSVPAAAISRPRRSSLSKTICIWKTRPSLDRSLMTRPNNSLNRLSISCKDSAELSRQRPRQQGSLVTEHYKLDRAAISWQAAQMYFEGAIALPQAEKSSMENAAAELTSCSKRCWKSPSSDWQRRVASTQPSASFCRELGLFYFQLSSAARMPRARILHASRCFSADHQSSAYGKRTQCRRA